MHAPAYRAVRDPEFDCGSGERSKAPGCEHRSEGFERRQEHRAVHGAHISLSLGSVCQVPNGG